MHLQQNIAFIRKHKKITYAELGEAIGASEAMAKTYELKGVTPPLPILCALADYAGLSLDALVREELSAANYSVLHHPQGSPGAIKQLQEQIDDLNRRLHTVERRSKVIRKRSL